MKEYTAIVLAGSDVNDQDPLLLKAGVNNKALIRLNGKTMISYVLSAVDQSKRIEKAIVVGITKDDVDIELTKEYTFIESEGSSRTDTIFTGFKHARKTQSEEDYLIILPSDLPLINSDMIDDCIDAMNIDAGLHEGYYGVVFRDDYHRKFPHSNRSWRYLKDGVIAAGDIHAIKIRTILANEEIICNLISKRKSFVGMILKFSPLMIIRYFLKSLGFKHLVAFVRKAFKIDAVQYIIPHPEAGMDLDYLDQLPKFENYIVNNKFE